MIRKYNKPLRFSKMEHFPMDKNERLQAANEFIKTIAGCGRKFFQHKGFTSYMEVSQQGHIFFIDYYTKKRIYTHNEGRWQGFTSGGTLRLLIGSLRDFISKGETMSLEYFQPETGNGYRNPWGYGDDLSIVHDAARRLGVAE